jgi:multiple sugar transport system permease protein
MAVATRQRSLFNSRRGRIIKENLTAYAFLAPALILVFVFGLFPVAFAFFVSLHRWRRFPDAFIGVGNFERTLGNLSYVLLFWLAVGALFAALIVVRRMWQRRREDPRAFLFAIPGLAAAALTAAVTYWFFTLLPVILDIPQRLRTVAATRDTFINEMIASFSAESVLPAANLLLVLLPVTLAVIVGFMWWMRYENAPANLGRWALVFLLILMGILIFQANALAFSAAVETATAAGDAMPLWSQVLMISVGAVMVIAAFYLWRAASRTFENARSLAMLGAAFLLAFGGIILVMFLPPAINSGDAKMFNGFANTVWYSLGTVPLQIIIGMVLAYMLFQKVRGRTLFRIVYFLPYIMPWIATSIVFRLLFSNRAMSPANQFIGNFGIVPQKWLLEPTGVFELMIPGLPDLLAGPGLALVVIMIYGIWTYMGYDAVVFLAGLGGISPELYEAARIDGANKWHEFRYITFPLLSPTTFYLVMIAVIGTFQAFTQIYIMRTPAASRAVDVVSLYVYDTVSTNNQLGYGSALAIVLFAVILILTLVQSRLLGRRVFYG